MLTLVPPIGTRAPDGSRGIDDMLTEARARLDRYLPWAAYRAQAAGAILVDIRPVAQRAEFGTAPGALIIERNVLEWRFDPRSDARLAIADRYDLPVIVFCQEGYTSSLAAAALQDLGLHRATDLAGGFAAWRAEGLPTVRHENEIIHVVPDSRSVFVGAAEISLTRVEFDLLAYLAEHPRRVFDRTQLLRNVWGYEHAGLRTVDVHIRRLRAKLGVRLVTTVRGVGYRLASEAAVSVAARTAV
jgi:rhodanese-related sulfurtransferase/DNA-binding winged helix-turn-helix (wHTH) protein